MTLTTDEAAARVGVAPVTVRQWVVRGWLHPVRRETKPLRFKEADVVRCHADRRPAAWHTQVEAAATRWREQTCA